MKEMLTITDITRMTWKGRVCVAGYKNDLTCVRPLIDTHNPHEDWLRFDDNLVISPFHQIELDMLDSKPNNPPHTEDWNINGSYKSHKGVLDVSEQKKFLSNILDDNVESIFGAPIIHDRGYFIQDGSGNRSLGTIVPQSIDNVSFEFDSRYNKWKYRITFCDNVHKQYQLSVTDLAFRYYLDKYKSNSSGISTRLTEFLQDDSIYLRLGLARGWSERPGKCFLQITGVYSYPDYKSIEM